MKQYDLIAFDLDGTLTDPASGLIGSFSHALGAMGVAFGDPRALVRYIGPPLYDAWRRDFGFSEEECERALAHFRDYYSVRGWCDNVVYPDVAYMLATLRAAGKKIALATSKPEFFARRILAHFGLSAHFDFIGGAEDERVRDKKWEVLSYTLEKFPDIPRERAVLVGDRMYDVEGARICGIDAIGVTYGYGTRVELSEAGASAIVDTPRALLALLLPDL